MVVVSQNKTRCQFGLSAISEKKNIEYFQRIFKNFHKTLILHPTDLGPQWGAETGVLGVVMAFKSNLEPFKNVTPGKPNATDTSPPKHSAISEKKKHSRFSDKKKHSHFSEDFLKSYIIPSCCISLSWALRMVL